MSLPLALRTLVAAGLLLSPAGPRSFPRSFTPAADSLTAFRDVTVLPLDTERTLDHHTVIVRGDRIVALGPAGETTIPDGALIVDGVGKFLMPGLADMHIHMPGDTSAVVTANHLALLVNSGVTTVRVLNGLRRHLPIRDSVARGGLFGPTMYIVGSSVGALQDSSADMRRVLSGAEVARFAEQMKAAGFDFIQVNNGMLRGEYEGLVSAARKSSIPLTGAVPQDAGLARVIRAHQASIENLDGYLEFLERPDSPIKYADPVTRARRLPDYFDEARIPKLAADLRAAGIANTPTLFVNHVGATLQVAESLAAWPEMKYMNPRTVVSWIRQVRRAQELNTDPARNSRYLEYRNRVTKGLSDGGALVLVGSDTPGAFLVPGQSTIYEIHSLTVAGLSQYQALRAATRSAATFMNAETEFGGIAPGMRADLLLLDGNPLADISNLTLRSGVMLRGRWHPGDVLDTMMARIAGSWAPPANTP